MICLDVDGTLMSDEKIITQATIREIRRAADNYGVKIIVSSSRMPGSMEIIAKELETPDPLIAYNGALVLDNRPATGKRTVLASTTIDNHASAEIVKFCSQHDLHTGIFRADEWYVNAGGYWTDREMKNTRIEAVVCDLAGKISEWQATDEGAHKIMLRGTEQDLNAAQGQINQMLNHLLVTHRIKDTILEITPLNISKANAAAFLCERFGISRQQVIAFGDSANDLDILSWAGKGVAMGNATDKVKQAASEVTLSNNEDGIAVALNKYFK